jgi:hypothetical protein
MKYLLLIYGEEGRWGKVSDTERETIIREYMQFSQDIAKSGHYLGGNELHPTSKATSVRVRDGKPLVSDGPFTETKEALGGYYLVEAKDLDEAIALAARIPSARWGTIEVRPIIPHDMPS